MIRTSQSDSTLRPFREISKSDRPSPLSGWRVLVVDDDEMVRRVSSRMLEESEVLVAGSGAEACKVLEDHPHQELDCVLLDMKMPGLSFEESFESIRRIRPDLAVVACSGNSSDAVGPGFIDTPRTGFLGKPFTRQELRDAIDRAVVSASA
jgi:CheY-like chemotaxis protein